MKRFAALLLAVSIPLTACQQQSEGAGSGIPDAKPGISLAKGRLVLNAVKDNPSAGYFTLTNNSDKPITLAAVHIDGVGRSEIHGNMATKHGKMHPLRDLVVEAGRSAVFDPRANHVMAFDLNARLVAGGITEMTLTFADGDKVSGPLRVEPPGGANPGDRN